MLFKNLFKKKPEEPKPISFEIAERQVFLKSRPIFKKFITVTDEFTHHYTGEQMVHIRIEWCDSILEGDKPKSYVEFKCIPKARLEEYKKGQFIY